MAEDAGVPRSAPPLGSNLVPFGRWGGTRKAGSTVAESGEHCRGEPGRAAKAEGTSIVDEPGERAEPLCARIIGANREGSEGIKAEV